MTRGTRARYLLTALLVAVSTVGAGPVGGVPVARADGDRVTERATITYRLDRKRARVHVTASFRWTNQIPSTAFRRYYLEQWGPIGVPTYAKDLKVKGRGVRAQRFPTGGAFDNVIVSFPRIYRGQTVSFTATWTLPSRGAESNADVRVTDAYSYFCWTGQPADSGSVTVVVPKALEAVTRGSTVRTSKQGSARRITARPGANLATFYACTDVYDRRLLARREVLSPGGRVVSIEGWPDDQAWLDEATTSVEQALAGLEAVVGAPLPGDRPIGVRQVAANALMGYGGEFDPGSGIIRVGEEGAPARLLAHELAHTWFNDRTLSTEWLWEGLAEWTARTAAGSPCQPPGEYPAKGSPRLGKWRIMGLGAALDDQAVVEYQYLAACSIMEQVSEAIGPEAMREVLRVLLEGESPYDLLHGDATPAPSPSPSPSPSPTSSPSPSPSPSPSGRHVGPQPRQSAIPATPTATAVPIGTPAPSTAPAVATSWSATSSKERRRKPVDWRQWLDVVDEVGLVRAGAQDQRLAERLLLRYGVARRAQLDGRDEARTAFHALRTMAPGGVTPAVVRRLMDDWKFRDARAVIRLARGIASELATMPQHSPDVADLWARYERATSTRALERLQQATE